MATEAKVIEMKETKKGVFEMKGKGKGFKAKVVSFGKELGCRMKESAKKVWAFIKKHAIDTSLAMGTAIAAGTVVSGLEAALVVGGLSFVAIKTLVAALKSKKGERAKAVREGLVDNVLKACTYGLTACLIFTFVLPFVVVGLFDIAWYSYVGYIYATYFLVA